MIASSKQDTLEYKKKKKKKNTLEYTHDIKAINHC